MAGEPIYRNLPQVQRGLEEKYSSPNQEMLRQALDPKVFKSALAMDVSRVKRGQMPVPELAGLKAALAAQTKSAVTPEDPNEGFMDLPGNFVKDVKTIVKSIPHLPKMLVNEAKSLGNIGDEAKKMDGGLGDVFELPGVRLLPGAFIASGLLPGGAPAGELLKHPVMTGLDALPAASKIASGSKVFKAAQEAAELNRLGGGFAPKPRPLSTVITNKLDDAGKLERTTVGKGMDVLWDTRGGQAAKSFNRQSRDVQFMRSGYEQEIFHRLHGSGALDPNDVAGRVGRDFMNIANDPDELMTRYGITEEQATKVGEVGRFSPEDYATLEPGQRAFYDDIQKATNEIGELEAARGELVKYKGEFYDKNSGGRIVRAEERFQKSVDVLTNGRKISRGKQSVPTMERVQALAAGDKRWAEVQGMLEAGDYSAAAKRVAQLKKFKGEAVGFNDQQMRGVYKDIREAGLNQRTAEAVYKATPSARFQDLVTYRAARETVDTLHSQGLIKDPDGAMRWVREGVVDNIPGWDAKEMARNQRGIAKTWTAMKATGDDPVFIHRVPEKQLRQITNPRLDGSVPSASHLRERVSDMSPAIDSPAIAVTHQAFEAIRKEVGTEFTNEIMSRYGIPGQELRDQFMDTAIKEAGRDVRVNANTELNRLIERRYMRFDPNGMAFGKPTVAGGESIYVPREVGKVLEQAKNAKMSDLRVYSDPVTRTMRVSLLALSPRWHFYNIFGGGMMVSAIASPAAFKNLPKAVKIARAAMSEGDDVVDVAAREGIDIPKVLAEQFGSMGREEAELAFKKGATMRRWADEGMFGGVKKAGAKVVQESYNFNARVDTMYKAMAYIYGEEKALARYTKAGYKPNQAKILAQQDGMEMARSVLQDTGGMLPIERSVFRQIVPFYGWLSHLMRFAVNFPLDHPWRAAIFAGGARQVMDDLGDGASLDMLDLLHYGDTNEKGEQNSIRLGGLNPFSDLGNLFTISGWLGQTNPLFKTALQTLGYDTQQGGMDLYPTLSYSPETGRLAANTGNPLSNLMANTIPQSTLITQLAGLSPEMRKLRAQDPEAADRMIWTSLGVPAAVRPSRDSVDQRYMKAELARQDARKKKITAALKDGDPGAIADLPDIRGKEEGSMAELATTLEDLQRRGLMKKFTPPSPEETP